MLKQAAREEREACRLQVEEARQDADEVPVKPPSHADLKHGAGLVCLLLAVDDLSWAGIIVH